jgi:hypothetical protein
MKYIITEQQNMLIYVLRRVEEDFDLIWDIVDEGVDEFICNFDNFQEYYDYVCLTTAKTYLYHYFENEEDDGYSKMEEYLIEYVKKNFRIRIMEYWDFNNDEC